MVLLFTSWCCLYCLIVLPVCVGLFVYWQFVYLSRSMVNSNVSILFVIFRYDTIMILHRL